MADDIYDLDHSPLNEMPQGAALRAKVEKVLVEHVSELQSSIVVVVVDEVDNKWGLIAEPVAGDVPFGVTVAVVVHVEERYVIGLGGTGVMAQLPKLTKHARGGAMPDRTSPME